LEAGEAVGQEEGQEVGMEEGGETAKRRNMVY